MVAGLSGEIMIVTKHFTLEVSMRELRLIIYGLEALGKQPNATLDPSHLRLAERMYNDFKQLSGIQKKGTENGQSRTFPLNSDNQNTEGS